MTSKTARGGSTRGRPRKAKISLGGDMARELGTRLVDDPLALEPGVKLSATVNLKEHALAGLEARGNLTPAQVEAGRSFRKVYEAAQIGAAGGIDPERIRVDGGGGGHSVTLSVLQAHQDLKRYAQKLGRNDYALVSAVCGAGYSLNEMAKACVNVGSAHGSLKVLSGALRLQLANALDRIASRTVGAGVTPTTWRAAESLGVALMPADAPVCASVELMNLGG